MTKDQALRLAVTIGAGYAAFKFRKYRWVASALLPVVASGVQTLLQPNLARAQAPRKTKSGRREEAAYL